MKKGEAMFIENVLRPVLQLLCSIIFRVRIEGIRDQFKQDRLLIIANHESWLDGLLLGLFLPVRPVFVVYTGITGRWFFRMALSLVDYLKVDPTSPLAMKRVVELIKSGRPVMIFPEGRLTITGTLMKVYDGPAFAALKTGATVVPVRIDGAGRSRFTRLSGNHPRQFFPKITISVQDSRKVEVPEKDGTGRHYSAKERRREAGESMRRIMQEMLFVSSPKRTIFGSFVEAAKTFGTNREIMADVKQLENPTKTMGDYRYKDLLKMAIALGRLVAKHTAPNECVGILMPNLAATVAMVLGVSAHGRVPAMLNYKAGTAGMQDACTAAAIKTVIASRAFLEKGKLTADVEGLSGIEIVYLEDVRDSLGAFDKLAILWYLLFPDSLEEDSDIERPAVVLFTSGSEGKPKGVVLSHRAIVANVAQVQAVFDFSVDDRVLNALPIFHSFGLTGGVFLPLFSGLHLVLYATPLHYKVIPEIAYDRNCTVLFGTSTFLANYGKHAHPYDFFRLRYVVAGAEKLSDAVRTTWFEKFGKRIFEGYGATETAPVLAVNTPMAYRTGTVGQFLPSIEYRLLPVPGISHGGALYVRGPNVMSGYYRFENPGILELTSAVEFGPGWYATGDVVVIEDGFVKIVDRVKRFAKVGGEMVSLTVVEAMASRASPKAAHGVTTIPDERKGETLVLFTTDASLSREMLLAAAQETGVPEIAVPRDIRALCAIPLLGTGKTDHVALKKLALAA